jgi:FAD-dependent oxidoreductase
LHLQAALVVNPTTEEEIVHAVATAVKNKQKIKVATKSSHTIPKLACPGTTNSTSGSGHGVIISTANYASIVHFDIPAMTVTAQSGILMHDLIAAIGNQNLALPFTSYWNAVTLGGSLATASHGSSHFGKGGAVHEYVTGLRLVIPATDSEGFAKVVALTLEDGDSMNAAKVSVGVLGVVSTVTLQLQPLFKRNLSLEYADTDVGLEDRILQVAETVEFGDVTWFPSLHQVVYRIDQRASESAAGDGLNQFYGFQPRLGVEIEAARAIGQSANPACTN